MHAISMEISDLSQEEYNMCDVVYDDMRRTFISYSI